MLFRSYGHYYHFARTWLHSIFPFNTFIFIFLYQEVIVIANGDQFFFRNQFGYGITF
ncbi:MAG: hypothetical protein N838_29560 [Thiohalocapsa sp. PB-PSB1]|nr:MAG: hypothetical protein N838_29560 [Thiohalocapsa sp. PB-PSB1]